MVSKNREFYLKQFDTLEYTLKSDRNMSSYDCVGTIYEIFVKIIHKIHVTIWKKVFIL